MTGVALVVWRSRRLGPLAVEPLPVRGQGRRDDAQPRAPLPPGRRPPPRRGGPAVRRPGPDWPSAWRLPHHTDARVLAAAVAEHTGRRSTRSRPCSGPMPPHPPTTATWPTWPDSWTSSTERCPTHDRPHQTGAPPRPPTAGRRATTARARLAAVRAEVAKAVVGQDAAVSGLLVALLCGGHVLMEGVPGVAKTLLVRSLAAALSVRHQPGAVHPRPDARRHHRLDGDRRRTRRAVLPRGPRVHQPAPGRRDQPHPTQDPVGAARGDGGGAGVGGRRLPRPARAVPGRRDPEPGGVRGHLPPARGPARPLPAQGRAPGPGAGRGARDRAASRDRLRPARRRRVGGDGGRRRRRTSRPDGGPSAGCSSRPRSRATSSTSRGRPVRHRPSGSAPARAARCR